MDDTDRKAMQIGYYIGFFTFGASMGFWAHIISSISNRLFKIPLGFAPIGLVNIIKTSLTTGSVVLIWTYITALIGYKVRAGG